MTSTQPPGPDSVRGVVEEVAHHLQDERRRVQDTSPGVAQVEAQLDLLEHGSRESNGALAERGSGNDFAHHLGAVTAEAEQLLRQATGSASSRP